MANQFNYFGAVFTDIIALYPNTTVSDYPDQVTIEAAMDRAVRRLTNAMPKRVHDLLTDKVMLEVVDGPAYGGEGPIFTIGLGPITDTTKLKLYILNGNRDGSQPLCPLFSEDNQSGTLSGTGNQTLTLTTPQTTLTENQYLYATYEIDASDATFSMPSFADYVIYSAGAELGHKLFDQQTDTWELVTKYERLAGDSDDPANNSGIFHELKKGEFVTDAIRSLEFCESVEPAGTEITSIRRPRA